MAFHYWSYFMIYECNGDKKKTVVETKSPMENWCGKCERDHAIAPLFQFNGTSLKKINKKLSEIECYLVRIGYTKWKLWNVRWLMSTGSRKYYLFPPTRKLELRCSYFLSHIFQLKSDSVSGLFCLSDSESGSVQQKQLNNFQHRFLRQIQVLDIIIKIFYLIINKNQTKKKQTITRIYWYDVICALIGKCIKKNKLFYYLYAII